MWLKRFLPKWETVENVVRIEGPMGLVNGALSLGSTLMFLALQRIPRQKVQNGSKGFDLNLNVAAGIEFQRPGWLAVDKYYQGESGVRLDLLEGEGLLGRFEKGSVDAIYMAHALEHFTYAEGAKILLQFHQLLRPGGVLRLVLPDVLLASAMLAFGPHSWWKYNQSTGNARNQLFDHRDPVEVHSRFLGFIGVPLSDVRPEDRKNEAVARGCHFSAYTWPLLRRALMNAGFSAEKMYPCRYGETKFAVMQGMDDREMSSLHAEAVR